MTTKAELNALLDRVAEILTNEDLSYREKVREIEDEILEDDDGEEE